MFSHRCVLPFNFPFNLNCDFQRVQNFNFNAAIFFVFKVCALSILSKKSLLNPSSQIFFQSFLPQVLYFYVHVYLHKLLRRLFLHAAK